MCFKFVKRVISQGKNMVAAFSYWIIEGRHVEEDSWPY